MGKRVIHKRAEATPRDAAPPARAVYCNGVADLAQLLPRQEIANVVAREDLVRLAFEKTG